LYNKLETGYFEKKKQQKRHKKGKIDYKKVCKQENRLKKEIKDVLGKKGKNK
jgi:hypothetical protein